MVRVVGPLLSLQASGSIADAITVRCGTIIHKKIMSDTEGLPDAMLSSQQKLFQEAASIWQSLSPEIKKEWKDVVWRSVTSPMCLALYLTFSTLMYAGIVTQGPVSGAFAKFGPYIVYLAGWEPSQLLKLLMAVGGLFAAVRAGNAIEGYQLWMSCYLVTRGEHWESYPLPPPAFSNLHK